MVFLVALEAYLIYSYTLSFSKAGVEAFLKFDVPKPYVYRVLVPLVSNGNLSLAVAVVVFFACGFFLASDYLYQSLGINRHKLASFLGCQVLFLATLYQLKPYDYATAFFFVLLLALMVNNKHGVLFAVFALATLNRETTFLIIGFYAVWFWGKIPTHKYYANLLILSALFISIRLITQLVFIHSTGTDMWYTLPENIEVYARYWYASLPMLAVFMLIVFSNMLSNDFVRKAILFIFVPQVILFLISGKPFETRVFAESISIVPLLPFATALSLILHKESLFQRPFDTST